MIGLYIHIPFCQKKCPYCDFISFDNKKNLIDTYILSLEKELLNYKIKYNINFSTLYIGGGTPSILSEKQLERLFFKVYSIIKRENLKEITIEINPGTITEKKAEIIKNNINRISIGSQSFNDKILKFIGRIHNVNDIIKTYKIFRKLKVENINLDLIYGIPGQSVEEVLNDIRKTIDLQPEHISFYLFTIDKKRFKNKKMLDDTQIEKMYLKGSELLKKNKYLHYEISNFAKKGKFCLHNMNYWNMKEYIGIGVSASSFYKGKRFKNVDNLEDYIKRINLNKTTIDFEEKIENATYLKEFIMLKLRTSHGINLKEFNNNFKFDFYNKYSNIIYKYKKDDYIKIKKNKLFLTEKGFLLSNEIIKDFF